ncbi:hypothetical protein Emin_0895 [Elusimicrobium minutum Pei191]|uniref:Uncharacterized protein n=1 Tax=Elusimicrobium minutum (strain Pei191) TaxID=445932 RepID=B2KD54_ELUMP|nr:LytR C-terminal domain-containing protein [Elusimicrobium minutum]ACC98450.1 hypothetical protein Emin_0895 [Elusimicrobium minutum Pei191]
MEQSRIEKIKNYLIIGIFLIIMACAFFAQRNSFIAQLYTGKAADNFNFIILSEPAIIMTYSPEKNLVTVANASLPAAKKTKNPPPELTDNQKALKLLEQKNISAKNYRFFNPSLKTSEENWNKFINTFSNWRYNPLLCAAYVYGYVKAIAQKRTNLRPYEFALLTLGLLNKEPTDFSITLDLPKSKKQTSVNEEKGGNSPLTTQDRPLIVEIYNASGEKGAALALTQYLRNINEKGLINIDVLQYDNYNKTEEQTKIIDHSGRIKEIKQLSVALGLRDNALFNENAPAAYCDAKIIIGKNFKMPK